jgi:hypothetical protein
MRRAALLFAVVPSVCGGVASSALAAASRPVARAPLSSATPPRLPNAVAAPSSSGFGPVGVDLLANADPAYDAAAVFAVKQRITSFSAVPAQLPSSGGRVELAVVVSGAARCLFTSGNGVKGLPVQRRCASGQASVAITLAANATHSAKIYEFNVSAGTTAGSRTIKHVLVTVRSAAHPQQSAPPQTVVVPQTVVSPQQPVIAPTPVVAPTPVAPQITVQPQNQNVPVGSYATFTAAASGVPTPSVLWQLSSDGGASWTNAPPTLNMVPTNYSVLVWGQAGTYGGAEYRAVFENDAGSATSSPGMLTVPINENTLFAGYLDTAPMGESFTAASADWIVPAVTCAIPYSTFAAQWPGVGENTSVVQDGTIEGCAGLAVASDAAWYELVGDAAVNNGGQVELPIDQYPVAAGDHFAASVSLANSVWTLSMTDSTQGWTFSITEPDTTPPLDETVAQVFTESSPAGVANFGTTTFTDATATLNGHSGPLGSFYPVAQAEYTGSTPLDVPGPLDSTGESFTDTWEGY